jgi:hypothetical protein
MAMMESKKLYHQGNVKPVKTGYVTEVSDDQGNTWEPVQLPPPPAEPEEGVQDADFSGVKDLEPPEPPARLLSTEDAPRIRETHTCEFPVSGNNPFGPGDYTTPICGRSPAAQCHGHRLKYYICEYHWVHAHPPNVTAPKFPL